MRVVLQSAPGSAASGRLELSDAQWSWHGLERDHLDCSASVYVGDEEQSVKLWMNEPHVRDMVGFFDDMGRHSRGWSGVMSWSSENYEINLDADNPAGEDVTLDVLMRLPPNYEGRWSGVLVVNADALPRAAEAIRKLTGLEEGRRFLTPHRARTWQPN